MIETHSEITEKENQRYEELQQEALVCARNGELDMLLSMIDAGLPKNLRDTKGNSLLMLACYHDHSETARMLLENGADPDARNDRGQTPLGGVAFKGYQRVAQLLVDSGAEIDADNGGGMTPLMYARMFGRVRVARLLEESGADRARKSAFGFSAKTLGRISMPFVAMAALFQGKAEERANT